MRTPVTDPARKLFKLRGRFPCDSKDVVITIASRRTWRSVLALEKKTRADYERRHPGEKCETWIE